MSKYDPLWHYVSEQSGDNLTMSFADIENVLGFPIDHSFLKFKKELAEYGWSVGKISMKNQTVAFQKL
ncbi:MAG: hypothetical protein MJZ21_00510 [archaeon]|nr:hypothetical protein [archaeon]